MSQEMSQEITTHLRRMRGTVCPRRLCDRCIQNWLESGTRVVNIWKAEDGFGKSGVMPENSMEAMNGENFGDVNPYLRKLRIKRIFEITIFHCMCIYISKAMLACCGAHLNANS